MSELSSTRRILVADDDPERLQALVARLQREGFDVLSAQDGLEALDRAREEVPDAIILNLLLRRIDGLRVCEILKSNPATTNIPVLLMAGVHVDADEGKRALAAGADRFRQRFHVQRMIPQVLHLDPRRDRAEIRGGRE